jgi:hypothetical protein
MRAVSCALLWSGAHGRDWSDVRAAVLGLPNRALLGATAASLLCASAVWAGIALREPSLPELEPAIPTAAPVSAEHLRTRCEGCGFVEAIRVIDGADGQPATYGFTVRLRDGSSRTSITPDTGRWQVGDRIIVMGGADRP